MNILFVRLDHLGDLILTTPLLRALGQAGHRVEIVVPRAIVPVFQGNPHVAACSAIEDLAPGYPGAWSWWQLGRWIRRGRFDAILLANPRPRQILLSSLFSGIRTRLALSGGLAGRFTLHRCLPTGPAFAARRHVADLQLDLARALGIPIDGIQPNYFLTQEESRLAGEKLAAALPGTGPIVGLHPGCMGNTCNLPPAVYGELAGMILDDGRARVVVTGSARERALTEGWSATVRESSRLWLSHGELDLRMLAGIISHLSVYIVPGTGPLHLASALRVRTLSPMCPMPRHCAEVWGNRGGAEAVAVGPPEANCEVWCRGAEENAHCDFRGEVTAAMLWARLEPMLSRAA